MRETTLPIWQRVLSIAGLAAAYVVTAIAGIYVAKEAPTPIWFPAGIATGCLLVFGAWLWPAVFVGALVTNALSLGLGLVQIPVATGNTLEVLAAVYFIRLYANGTRAFESPTTVWNFAILGAGLSSVVGAVVGSLSFLAAGAIAPTAFASNLLTWWLGDAAGIIVMTPVILQIAQPARLSSMPIRVVDGVLLVSATTLTGLFIFGGLTAASTEHYPLPFLVLPVLIWAAYRFGPPGTALANLIIAVIATWGTQRGLGPFETPNPNFDFLMLETFLGVYSLSSLLLAAGFYERQRALAAERTAEEGQRLAEERQRESERQRADAAEAARNQLRDFLGMVVHDLRGPLTVTLGYTQFLRPKIEAAGLSREGEILGKVETSLRTMSRLIDDLLDATRLGSGRFTIRTTETDLVALVRAVVDEQETVDQTHRLTVNTPARLVGSWDDVRLRQVVTNLVANARTYSAASTEIRVDVVENAGRAVLSISDQGPGIAPDKVDQVFQPFVRLDSSRPAGAGLGLYISRGIVEAHHGRIWVTSAVGRGSTFWIELPILPASPNG
jgi:signal transduction histidine kinase